MWGRAMALHKNTVEPRPPQPMKAGLIVVPCGVSISAGIKFVGFPQPKPMHRFSPNFQGIFIPKGSRVELEWGPF